MEVTCPPLRGLAHAQNLQRRLLRTFPGLKNCQVSHCDSMRNVICSCCCDVPLFQSLESLELDNLPMLTDLVERERSPSSLSSSILPIGTFSSLKELAIRACHGLKRLFTPTHLSHLQSLESCLVLSCWQLEEIIGETSDEDENKEAKTAVISMPSRFRTLSLYNLPELKSLCNSSIKISHSLENIHIYGCQRLKDHPAFGRTASLPFP